MTSQSPRIYIYKITFEEVLYYYYGVHKERKYNEYYMGTPVTHKWCWEFYTPKKQILEIFDCTDEGWLEAQEVETRLIRPFYQTDKLCLNENCGGKISLEVIRQSTKKGGQKAHQLGVGAHGLTNEERSELVKRNGQKIYRERKGIFARTKEKMSEDSKKAGKKSYEMSVGVHGQSKEQLIELGKKTTSQKWKCTITGHISNPGGLSNYQKKRGIDTSKRKRVS